RGVEADDVESITPAKLSRGLLEWTTAEHRNNVRNTLVFHAADVPQKAAHVTDEADAFVTAVNSDLWRSPQPHQNHPHWMTALSAHRATGGHIPQPESEQAKSKFPRQRRSALLHAVWNLRFSAFGCPPDVRPWHPRWPDFHLPFKLLSRS